MPSFADILKQMDSARTGKLSSKLPQWAAVEGIRIANSLALEQCSSSAAALSKARFVAGIAQRGPVGADGVITVAADSLKLADLTGGMGVDSWAFSQYFRQVWYNEMQEGLCRASKDNFQLLGRDNILCNNYLIDTEQTGWLESLRAFLPDVVYLDPARRSATGSKVFLPEDCSPNFIALLPVLKSLTAWIVVKLSPMADISMLRSRIGGDLVEIRVVGLESECKELLCVIKGGTAGQDGCSSTGGDNVNRDNAGTDNATRDMKLSVEIADSGFSLDTTWEAAKEPVITYAGDITPGMLIAEMHAAVMKAGLQDVVAHEMGLIKISPFTHVYVGDLESTNINPAALKGSFYRICDVLPLNKAGMKYIGKTYGSAEFTARGIHLTSEQLCTRCGCKKGGSVHIFGVAAASGNLLIVSQRA